MKQSLELKLGQRLTMTPQLQHAIRLLQLSALELANEIQEALQTNPLLEETDAGDEADTDTEVSSEHAATEADENDGDLFSKRAEGDDNSDESPDSARAIDEQLTDDVGTDAPDGDDGWESGDDDFIQRTDARGESDAADHETDWRDSAATTLQAHLLWQMRLTPFSERDASIAQALIDGIDADGYLRASLHEVRETVPNGDDIELDEIEAVLHQIQNFDPAGVGARDLGECLVLQLRQMPLDRPLLDKAITLASTHLQLLADHDFGRLRKVLTLDAQQLQELIDTIRALNPRPGTAIGLSPTVYVTPDLIVRKVNGRWRAALHTSALPEIRITRRYQTLLRQASRSADRKYLQDQLQEARWFLKSLQNRHDTLLKVAREIVARQYGFFDHGEIAMRPLVLADIARELSMHESTVSRVTTQKYMMTPRGIFELKYFFSSSVGTTDGGSCSATAIRSLIKKMVESEQPTRPISDSEIARILGQQGIQVARRTVAKYRDHMNIPPSSQRKSLG